MANDKFGGQQTLYMALFVIRKVAVAAMGMEKEIPLTFAEGMVGACPVFKTREQAEAFADGSCGVVELSILQANAEVSGGAVCRPLDPLVMRTLEVVP